MIESIFVIIIGAAMAMLFFGLMRKQGLFFFFLKKITAIFQRLKKFEESIENSQESLKILSSKRVVIFEGFIITIPSLILQAVFSFSCFSGIGNKNRFHCFDTNFLHCTNSGHLSLEALASPKVV